MAGGWGGHGGVDVGRQTAQARCNDVFGGRVKGTQATDLLPHGAQSVAQRNACDEGKPRLVAVSCLLGGLLPLNPPAGLVVLSG